MYRLILLFLPALLAAGPPPAFISRIVASDLKGGYQVVPADLNRDGKIDLIAVAQSLSELVWFENPSWQRHVIAGGLRRMVNAAAWDSDGDGIPELVLAHEFSNVAKNSLGIVSVLHHNGDPRAPWSIREIDRLTTAHRLRWADLEGRGRKVAVNAPLTGAAAEAPGFKSPVPLVFYRPGEWKRESIGEETQGVMHGIEVFDWDGDRRDEILAASFEGIHLYDLGRDGRWRRTLLAPGSPAPWPRSGASDVTVGKLGRRRFLASIEPWHGNEVAVYRLEGRTWRRQVIEDSFVDGHTVAAADLDGDGRDEIVAGYRGKGRSVYIYAARDRSGERWDRRPLDEGGMGAASCVVVDLNGDRRPDIACIGSPELKWYENKPGAR